MSLQRQGTLTNQTSQVFQMTLDELQHSVGASGKIASMNLEDFLATVWDQQNGAAGLSSESTSLPEVHPNSYLPSQHNGQTTDYSGKTVEEVWSAIQAGKTAQNGGNFEPIILGDFLQSVGVDMPSSVASDLHMTNLSLPLHKMESVPIPEVSQLPLVVPQHSSAMPSGDMHYPSMPEGLRGLHGEVHAMATIHMAPKAGLSKSGRVSKRKADSPISMPKIEASSSPSAPQRRQRKRKEPEIVDERTARLQKRMVKNRESAARSRARKQEYTAQLEVQVAALREENRALMEKIVKQCPITPKDKKISMSDSLKRTWTMPTPSFKKLLDDDSPAKLPEQSSIAY